jgi:hypothetical protein
VYNWYLVKILSKQKTLEAFFRNKGEHISFDGPGHYPFVHLQKIIQDKFGYQQGDFPILEDIHGKLLNLSSNIHWTKTEKEVIKIPLLLREFYSIYN